MPLELTLAVDLAPLRLEAQAKIDRRAEAERLAHVTPGAAQAMVYQAKQAEARRYVEAGRPASLEGYSLLAAEVPLTAPTAGELADLWLSLEARWLRAAAGIEARRLAAKAAVRAATNPAAVQAAVDAHLGGTE